MGLLDLASYNSFCRGYDYYREGKVLSCEQTGELAFSGEVKGGGVYRVNIDVLHPRSSVCNCPFANGTRKVCKHMVALYFAAFSDEAKRIEREEQTQAEAEEEYYDKIDERILRCLADMPRKQLESEFYELLCAAPEWLSARFIDDHDLYDYRDDRDESVLRESDRNAEKTVRNIAECIAGAEKPNEYYYNKNDGQIYPGGFVELMRSRKTVTRIKDGDFIPLPRRRDIDEYGFMRDFADRQPQPTKDILLNALLGENAEEVFGKEAARLGVTNNWSAYLNMRIYFFARDWLAKTISKR